MALSEKLQFILTADASGAIKGFQQIGQTADRELNKAEQKLDKLGGNLTKFGAGAVAFAGVAGAALFKLGGQASDLGESVNAVTVTFGEQADGILELGEKAAQAVGLSKTEFNGLAVQFSSFAQTIAGDGGNVVGTIDEMSTRAADFASVLNLDVPEAARIFQSALAGETEPIKKFGIDLSAASVAAYAVANGISESAASMTEAEKVQGRYGLLMESTSHMAGDFADTSDSLANQQRILTAELKNVAANIGAGVLPMMSALLGGVSKVTGAFSKLSPETQGAIGKFAAFGAAGIGMLGTMSLVAGQLIKMRDRFSTLDVDTKTRSLNNFGKAAQGMAVGLGIAGVALAVYSAHARAASDDINDMADALAGTARQTDEAATKTVQAMVFLGQNIGGLEPAIEQFVTGNIEAARRLVETGAAAEGGAEFLDLLTTAIKAEEEARAQNTAVLDEYGEAIVESTEATIEAKSAEEEYSEALDGAYDALNKVRQAHEAETAARRAAADATFAARQAEADFATQVQNTTEKLNDSTASTQAKQIAVDEAVLSAAELADAEVRIAQETATANGYTLSGKAAQQEWAQSMIESASQLDGPLRQSIIDYVAQVTGIPAQQVTQVFANTDEASVIEAEGILAELARERVARVQVRLAGGTLTNDGGISFGGGVRAFHDGGVVPGPRGSEQLAVLKAGETVLPTHKPSESRAPGGLNINIENANFQDREQIDAFASLLMAKLRAA